MKLVLRVLKTVLRYQKIWFLKTVLTLSWRTPLSYRNQSIDLPRKSMDWLLYDNGHRHERVKHLKRKCFSVLRQKQSSSHGVKDRCKNLQGFSFKLWKPFCLSSEQGFNTLVKFSGKLTFLPPDMQMYVCVTGGKNVSSSKNIANALNKSSLMQCLSNA